MTCIAMHSPAQPGGAAAGAAISKPVALPERARDTSAQALAAIGLKEMAGQCRMVFDCVRALQRRNAWPDCSLREIQQEFERQHQRRIDVGTVSGRVRQLLDMHWLQRRTDPRACRVTGKAVHPVYALPKQMEAFAA